MRLLRALQEREFERVGGNQTIKVDVRVIAATNSELPRMVAEGTFREDLFFRLNVINVTLPPLRERREDIPVLVKHFLQKFAPTDGPELSQEAMRAMMAFSWPGNVRQLENAMERAVTLGQGRKQIDLADLPPEVSAIQATAAAPFVELPEAGLDMPVYVAGIQRGLIANALERTRGNKNQAAELLRIKRTTLVEMLKRLDGEAPLVPPRFAYWTILLDGKPTAFRAAEREELLPTFKRLQDKHPDAVMRWFARGKLWSSPEEARSETARRAEAADAAGRGRNWRPGGSHRDPRQPYKDAKKQRNQDRRQRRFEYRAKDDQAGGPNKDRGPKKEWNRRRVPVTKDSRNRGRPGRNGADRKRHGAGGPGRGTPRVQAMERPAQARRALATRRTPGPPRSQDRRLGQAPGTAS